MKIQAKQKCLDSRLNLKPKLVKIKLDICSINQNVCENMIMIADCEQDDSIQVVRREK
jgi:hypothetical protein